MDVRDSVQDQDQTRTTGQSGAVGRTPDGPARLWNRTQGSNTTFRRLYKAPLEPTNPSFSSFLSRVVFTDRGNASLDFTVNKWVLLQVLK